MGDESVVKGGGTGLHFGGGRHDVFPLRVDAKDVANVFADAGVVVSGCLVAAGQEVEAAVLQRGVVERDPETERLAGRVGPVWIVEMPAGGVGPRLLDQCLVVPDANAFDPGQV